MTSLSGSADVGHGLSACSLVHNCFGLQFLRRLPTLSDSFLVKRSSFYTLDFEIMSLRLLTATTRNSACECDNPAGLIGYGSCQLWDYCGSSFQVSKIFLNRIR